MPSGYPLIPPPDDARHSPTPTMAVVRSITEEPECLLVTRDPSLIDAVSATALTLGTTPVVAHDRGELRSLWPGAGVRLVGVDMADRVSDLARDGGDTWVVGQADAALLAASARLRAPALALPDASTQLAEALTRQRAPQPSARIVAVVGGSGGVGVSSLTVALSLVAAKRGARVTALELTDCGGGLDLLLGLETAQGVRWSDVANASGELGSLHRELVSGQDISLLSLGREGKPARPSRAALDAVLRSLGRSQDLVLVDAGEGRHLGWVAEAQPVLVVAAHVRGVAAARMVAQQHEPSGAQVVVRTGPGATLPPQAVADALGLPLIATLRHDRAVPKLAGMGSSIISGPARRFRRDVTRIADGLLG